LFYVTFVLTWIFVDACGGHFGVLFGCLAGFLNVVQFLPPYLVLLPTVIECYVSGEIWWLGLVMFGLYFKLSGDMYGSAFAKLDISPFLLGMIYLLGLQVYGVSGIIYAPALVSLAGFGLRVWKRKQNFNVLATFFTRKR
jgi:predicted PurR-regulated permease PerM